jgi:probable rRNA maturation factor
VSGLRVAVSDGRGHAVSDGGLGRWLAGVAPRNAQGEVAIALVSDARMRVLNRSYRSKDYATDVLTFAPDDVDEASEGGAPNPAASTPHPGPRVLGDLVIATGVARRQAKEVGHSYQTELRVLALHGLLHLLGYDHETASDDGRMRRVETRLRKKGGLKEGLIQRAAGRPASIKRPASMKRLRLRLSGRREAPRSGAREGARVGVGPREHE